MLAKTAVIPLLRFRVQIVVDQGYAATQRVPWARHLRSKHHLRTSHLAAQRRKVIDLGGPWVMPKQEALDGDSLAGGFPRQRQRWTLGW